MIRVALGRRVAPGPVLAAAPCLIRVAPRRQAAQAPHPGVRGRPGRGRRAPQGTVPGRTRPGNSLCLLRWSTRQACETTAGDVRSHASAHRGRRGSPRNTGSGDPLMPEQGATVYEERAQRTYDDQRRAGASQHHLCSAPAKSDALSPLRAQALSQKAVTMKRSTFATCARTSVLALSVLLLPLATPTFAQPATPTPATRSVDTRAERDRTDLWGLLGLAGLLGLMGRRRPDTVQTYDTRARSRT
jgi:hypothetical protein